MGLNDHKEIHGVIFGLYSITLFFQGTCYRETLYKDVMIIKLVADSS